MSENPQGNNNHDNQQNPAEEKAIETVVKNLLKSQTRPKIGVKQGKPYEAIYKDIKEVLSQFDNSIIDCKKYNQAKIHRKYEIRIADLELQIKILRQKLRQQQNARSPSKKYIEDLVDQLVIYKNNNEALKTEAQILKNKIKQYEQKITNLSNQPQTNIKFGQPISSRSPELIKNSPRHAGIITDSNFQFNLKQEVINFLDQQKNIRKVTEQSKSKFEHFLKKKLQYINGWTFIQFLSQIDKWHAQNYNFGEQKLSSRLRSNALSTFEDEVLNDKKLPRIITPYSISSIIPSQNKKNLLNSSQIRRLKKRQSYNSKKHYSTLEVSNNRTSQKYVLK